MAKRRRRMNEQAMITPDISREALAALLERHGLGPLETVEPLDSSVGTLLVNGDLAIRCSVHASLRKAALIYRRLALLPDVPGPELLAFDTKRDLGIAQFDAARADLGGSRAHLRHDPQPTLVGVWQSDPGGYARSAIRALDRCCAAKSGTRV
jgi:hypothetical protein